MASLEEFWKNPLVVWVQTFRKDNPVDSVTEFADGVFLNKVMVEIDPSFFNPLAIQMGIDTKDLNMCVQNLAEVMRNIKRFYQESLHQLLVMKVPDVLAIAKNPESDYSVQQLEKILLLILGCAVQCERKEYFIEKIKDLDVEVQRGLVTYIQEVTENSDNVLSYRPSDGGELQHDQLLELSETMYYQIQKLVEERDEYVEATLDLNLEKQESLPKENTDYRGRSSPLSPSGSIKSSIFQANKQRLRDLQNELEERNLAIAELKEEINSLKSSVENLKQENKSLHNEARWAKTYRDEMDVLKSQVDNMKKMETENAKFKDKVRELDFYKGRYEELKEQHELLYETKMVLEEQVARSGVKVERVGHLDDENERLLAQIRLMTEERESDQLRIQDLLDENAKLNMDKQTSHTEIAFLNAEIETLKAQTQQGPALPLSMEYNASTSTELLRLEKENKHLMKLVDSLRDNTPRSRELERENLSLTNTVKEHKNTITKLTEELASEKSKALKLAEVADMQVDQVGDLELKLNSTISERQSIVEELEKKGIDLQALQQAMANTQLKLNDNDRVREEKLSQLKEEIFEKERQVEVLQSELQRELVKGDELNVEVTKKKQEMVALKTKVKESESYSSKVEQQLVQREKDIAALERRFESAMTENKSLSQSVNLKDDKISALEERITHLLDSASQDTRKVNKTLEQKLKQIRDLETRIESLQEQVSEQDRLRGWIKQKEEKMETLMAEKETMEGKVNELELQYEKARSSCVKLEHSIKLKDERISSLESSLTEIGSSNTLQQNDRISNLAKTIAVREQEVRDLEARVGEILSLNAKLKSSNRQKDDKIQALEDSISELEGAVKPSKEEKVHLMQEKMRKKEDEIVQLEERLEDATSFGNRMQRAVEVKEEKIQLLEMRIHQLEETAGQAQKLSAVLEEKTKRLFDAEGRIEEVLAENQKLQAKVKLKEERYEALEKTLTELEGAASDKTSLSKMLKMKESKILVMQKTIDEKDESLVEKDTLIEENQARQKKLMHALKLREEKLHALESRVEELEELESVSTKLGNLLRQREERIKELEDQLDALSEMTRQNDRLKDSSKQKDEKISSLEERLEDLEEAVKINERLNQQVHQKEDKISTLQLRIHGLEDSLHKMEQLKDFITKNAEDQIQELSRKVDELMDVKVKRQQSIRRREEKIISLESRLEEVASEREHKMTQIQELQSRLEGTMSKFRKLDLSNEEKDEKITELEARINELQSTYKENRRLIHKIKLKEETVIKLEARVEETESSNKRLTANVSEYEANVASLQQRLQETLSLNSRLDQSVKKQEEKIRLLDSQQLEQEERLRNASKEKESFERSITKHKRHIEDLETALSAREKDISDLEKRLSDFKVNEENEKNKAADLLRQRNSHISDLENKLKSMEKAAKTELVLLRSNREPVDKLTAMEKKIDEITNENHKMKLVLQEKDGTVSDLQRRIDEMQISASDSDKLNKIVKEKNSQISILRGNVEQYQKEVVELETRCESLRSESSRTQASIRQKDDRIQTLKSQMEENVAKVHHLSKEVSMKDEKIKSLERSLIDSNNIQLELREELNQMDAQLDELRQKLGTHVTEKIKYTKRASTDLRGRDSADGSNMPSISNEELELLRKEKARVLEQNEELCSLNVSLQTENEDLRSELETVQNEYAVVLEERDDAREQYKDIDVSAAKIAHRCEVLVKLNATLEEENKTLMDQVNKLLEQNQNLLFKSLESRDQFLEEERAFSDRLYFLEREKEKLVDQVDAANRALNESAQPKKKNLLWRGANKVLKKAGLKKKREDKPNVSLIRVTRSPEGESRSEASDSSFSPNQAGWRKEASKDEGMANTRSLSPEFAPIRAALSMSRPDLQSIGNEPCPYGSPSSGSEQSGPSSRMRPKSEFYPLNDQETPLKRPKSMEMLDALRVENESFLMEVENRARMHSGRFGIDRQPRLTEMVRKDSVNSNSSVRSNVSVHSSTSRQSGASSGHQSGTSSVPSQGGRIFNSVVTRDITDIDSSTPTRDSGVQKVRITETVIPISTHTHVRDDIQTQSENTNQPESSFPKSQRSESFTQATTVENSPQLSYVEPVTYRRPPPAGADTPDVHLSSMYSSPVTNNNVHDHGNYSGKQPPMESPRLSKSSVFYVPLEEIGQNTSTPARNPSDRIAGGRENGNWSVSRDNREVMRDSSLQRSFRSSVGQFEERTTRPESSQQPPQQHRRRTVGSYESTPQDLRPPQVDGFSREGRSSLRSPGPPPPSKVTEHEGHPQDQERGDASGEKKPNSLWYEYGCV